MTNPWAKSNEDEIRAGLEAFYAETGGLMRLCVVKPDDEALKAGIIEREPLALTLALTIADGLQRLASEDRERICLCCDHVFAGDPPGAFVVWVPGSKTTKFAAHKILVAHPVCIECAKLDGEVLAEHGTKLLQQIFTAVEIEGTDD